MGFACATPRLAIAVAGAGGIGAIAVGVTPPALLRDHVRRMKAATPAPFHVNCIAIFDCDAHVRVCADEGVPIVSWHWGHPSAASRRLLREAGIAYWQQVGSADEAKRAVDDGAELVIAQGWEAGGHNLQGRAGAPGLPTFVMLPTILDAVGEHAMVLGAGGVSDGRGVAAALALGADGVWVGTRLVATPESDVHDEHKRRIVASRGEDSVLSSIFGPELPAFNPMRVQRNRVVAEWNDRLAEVPVDPALRDVVGTSGHVELRKFPLFLPTPETRGDWEEMPWLMGQGVGQIGDVRPAGEVVDAMMREACAILRRLARAVDG
jgi:NAD(P)H-dependent flavin oxidoreductase YrpB (nitropropane dioxygenase family)